MSAYMPDSESLSYSARFCRRCRSTMIRQPGFLGRMQWRCEQCKPSMWTLAR
jgi:tRNA(Ile2) C34 agmatinyltransferase TiaS